MQPMLGDLTPSRRPILVIGASGSIGTAVARSLAGCAAHVGVHYRSNLARAKEVQIFLNAHNTSADLFASDLSSESACKELVTAFSSTPGGLGGLAICHGTINWKPWNSIEDSDWNEIFKQHCLTPYYLVKHAIPIMEACGTGRVVFLSSISPKYGGSQTSLHYAAAKSALETAMYGISKQVAGKGIRINGVRSGFVDTPLQRNGRTDQELETRISKIPVGRPGRPEEIASAIRYLLSDEADFITGEILTVAGGD